MVALIVEVGRCFSVLVTSESSTNNTTLVEDAALFLCLRQDVVCEV